MIVQPRDHEAEHDFILQFDADTLRFPLYSSHSLMGTHSDVRQLLIGLHGGSRNGEELYDFLLAQARSQNAEGVTWILAPQFNISIDQGAHNLNPGTAIWSSPGWFIGEEAVNLATDDAGWLASSFGIVDTLIVHATMRAPHLERIVIIGHSAGAQFSLRYAALNKMNDVFADELDIIYIAANSGTFLYLDGRRPLQPGSIEFKSPDLASVNDCPGWNDYPFGFQNRPLHMADRTPEEIRQQYLNSTVYLLTGDMDYGPTNGLGGMCAASLQGANRHQRATIFQRYIQTMQNEGQLSQHSLITVDNGYHDMNVMLGSAAAVDLLFPRYIFD